MLDTWLSTKYKYKSKAKLLSIFLWSWIMSNKLTTKKIIVIELSWCLNCVGPQWITQHKGFTTLLTFTEFLSSMNGFIMMKNIEVCKSLIILNRFMKFLSNTYSFMKMKTTELCSLNNIKWTHSVSFFHFHCYEKWSWKRQLL